MLLTERISSDLEMVYITVNNVYIVCRVNGEGMLQHTPRGNYIIVFFVGDVNIYMHFCNQTSVTKRIGVRV